MLNLFEVRWIEQDTPVRAEVRRCARILLNRPTEPAAAAAAEPRR